MSSAPSRPPKRPAALMRVFFLLDARHLENDLVGSTSPDNELSQLQWITIADSRTFDLPFITAVVLEEVDALIRGLRDDGVPFFNSTRRPTILERLR